MAPRFPPFPLSEKFPSLRAGLPYRAQNFIRIWKPRRIGHVPAVRHFPFGTDDQDRTAEDALQTTGARHQQVVALAELPIEITQQDHVSGQTQLVPPCVVRPRRVHADPVYLRPQRPKLFDSFSELGKFLSSPRAKVQDVRQQHNRPGLQGR